MMVPVDFEVGQLVVINGKIDPRALAERWFGPMKITNETMSDVRRMIAAHAGRVGTVVQVGHTTASIFLGPGEDTTGWPMEDLSRVVMPDFSCREDVERWLESA